MSYKQEETRLCVECPQPRAICPKEPFCSRPAIAGRLRRAKRSAPCGRIDRRAIIIELEAEDMVGIH